MKNPLFYGHLFFYSRDLLLLQQLIIDVAALSWAFLVEAASSRPKRLSFWPFLLLLSFSLLIVEVVSLNRTLGCDSMRCGKNLVFESNLGAAPANYFISSSTFFNAT